MSAWVSPPQLNEPHIVQTAASMEQVASTALPPLTKVVAPAVAASGLPVIATHWVPCRTGLFERWARRGDAPGAPIDIPRKRRIQDRDSAVCMVEMTDKS